MSHLGMILLGIVMSRNGHSKNGRVRIGRSTVELVQVPEKPVKERARVILSNC